MILIGQPVVVGSPHDRETEAAVSIMDFTKEDLLGLIGQAHERGALAVVLPADGGFFEAMLEGIHANLRIGQAHAVEFKGPEGVEFGILDVAALGIKFFSRQDTSVLDWQRRYGGAEPLPEGTFRRRRGG